MPALLLPKVKHQIYDDTSSVSVYDLQTLRRHGDILKRTVGGYLVVQGRADDTMNLGGIKV